MKKNTNTVKYKTIFVFMLFALVATQGCQQSNAGLKSPEPEGIPVRVAKIEKKEAVIPVYVSGNINASKESRLSFKTGGIIKSVFADEGDKVKQGQVLAELDLEEINEQVKQAKVGLEKAQRDYERVNALYKDTVATLEQLENTKSALDVAKANMNIAEYNLRFSSITAPSDGVILKRFFEENEIVNTGMPIFYFASAEELWQLTVGLSDKEIVKINLNDKAVIVTDAYPDKELECYVSRIANSPGPYTGLYEVELSIDYPVLKLKHGFFAKGKIFPTQKNECFSIPMDAVQEGIGNQAVFYSVSKDKKQAIKRKARIVTMDGNTVYIESDGIYENMLVIVDRQKELKHLDQIKIIEQNPLASN